MTQHLLPYHLGSPSPLEIIADKALSPIIPAMCSFVFSNSDSEPHLAADIFFLCAQLCFLALIFISNHFLLTSDMVLGTADTILNASLTSFQALILPVFDTPLLIDDNKKCFSSPNFSPNNYLCFRKFENCHFLSCFACARTDR